MMYLKQAVLNNISAGMKQDSAGKAIISKLEKEIQLVKPFRNNYHKAAVTLIFTGKWMI